MGTDFSGKVAVVTGGAKGIGKTIAIELARAGADVVIVGRDRGALDEAVVDLQALGRRAHGVAADLTEEAQAGRIVDLLQREFNGQVDAMVTCAGTRDHSNSALADVDMAQFDAVMRGNLHGSLFPIRAVVPLMMARRQGKIVTISGVLGLRGGARHGAACASKWALEGLTRVLALELGPHNINVNAVVPGYVEGPRSAQGMAVTAASKGIAATDIRKQLEDASALRRISTAQDIANAVKFLISEDARNITGQDIVVDAGWSL